MYLINMTIISVYNMVHGGSMDWEFGVSRCKLLQIELMDNKVLLYSTENYIQCPGINHNGKGGGVGRGGRLGLADANYYV